MRVTLATGLTGLVGLSMALAPPIEIPFHAASKVRFASPEGAAALLGTADSWVQVLSPFDRAAFTGQPEDPGQEAFLELTAAQAKAWTAEQIETLRPIVESADRRIDRLGLRLSLPAVVLLVRTNGNEMSRLPYTRGHAIILPDEVLASSASELEELFLHELFHVMSRHDPSIREPLYGIIGYRACPGVPFPEELRPLKMTNPDAYHRDACIDVEAADAARTVTPVIYAKGPYTEGHFFEWLVFRLMAVEASEGRWRPARNDDDLTLFDLGEVSGFFEKVGRNTSYLIHPEETMADNFAYAILERDDLPNPEISTRVLEALRPRETGP